MGSAAVRGADLAILTSDNPRSEDPLQILAEMTTGAQQALADMADATGAERMGRIVVEPDRASAIAFALAQARPDDAVVVAGKGHESGQESGGVVHPFDDRVVLRGALRELA
jgi:UDP-N-acetylmuramoyl-L-alanyl-D-glutamate--2,6-diaminopimelate ligase